MTNFPSIGFIGSGSMARAILNGLIQSGFPANKIWSADPNADQLQSVSLSPDIHRTSDNLILLENCDVVVLAVKPQILHSVLAPLADAVDLHQPLLVSLAAGIKIEAISRWCDGYSKIIRTMPNTPAQVRQGVTALCAHPDVAECDLVLAENIFQAVGITSRITDEEQLNLVTALSGSGPAYFFLMFEALENAACELGMERSMARALVMQTAMGASTLAQLSHLPPKILKDQVTSKGGTTEQALNSLDSAHFSQLILAAVKAAQKRSTELSDQLGEVE